MSEENAQPPEGAPDPGTADPQAQAGQPAPEGAIDPNPSPGQTKWQSFEIVDGQAVPASEAPTPAGVHLLDRARALPELAKEEAAHLIEEGIQAFKDLEGRTMLVVHRFGQLFKQEK